MRTTGSYYRTSHAEQPDVMSSVRPQTEPLTAFERPLSQINNYCLYLSKNSCKTHALLLKKWLPSYSFCSLFFFLIYAVCFFLNCSPFSGLLQKWSNVGQNGRSHWSACFGRKRADYIGRVSGCKNKIEGMWTLIFSKSHSSLANSKALWKTTQGK